MPGQFELRVTCRIDVAVTNAHRALNCRHYSLFDIRIDADERPFILEACLFCSFSPVSVIPSMATHTGRSDLSHPQLFHSFLERAIAENQNPCGTDTEIDTTSNSASDDS